MGGELEQVVRGYDDTYLLEQFFVHGDQYEAEALEVMRREIESRGFSDEQLAPYRPETGASAGDTHAEPVTDTYVLFEDTFSQTDLLLVHTILRESAVPFFVDNPPSTVVPLESATDRRYKIHVREDKVEQAHELLDDHFHRQEGEYRLKHTSVRDRLRGFSFLEMRMSEKELDEEVTLTFAEQEREGICTYGDRLLSEIETVEQQRPVFHFDTLAPVLERIRRGDPRLRMVELLTIVEVLQIYCDEPAFPPALLEVSGALLELFEQG